MLATKRTVEQYGDDQDDLVKQIEASQRYEKIQEEIKNCRTIPFFYPHPVSGEATFLLLPCNHWRHGCAKCLDERARTIRIGIENELVSGDLRMLTLEDSWENVRKFLRRNKLTKFDYTRMAVVPGVEVVFIKERKAQEHEITGGQTVSLFENPESPIPVITPDKIDYLALANTPEGYNRSGSLAKYVKPLPAAKFPAVIEVQPIVAENVSRREINKAVEQAVQEIANEPTTIKELQERSNARINRVIAILWERGAKIILGVARKIVVDTIVKLPLDSEGDHKESFAPELDLLGFISP